MTDKKDGRSSGERVSDVRRRTLDKMRALLAAGAATGAGMTFSACPPVVCDPLPPPLECSTDRTNSYYSQWVHVSATVVRSDGGPDEVEVRIEANGYGEPPTFPAAPEVTGANPENMVVADNEITFSFIPEPNIRTVVLSIPLDCHPETDRYEVELDLSDIDTSNELPVRNVDG